MHEEFDPWFGGRRMAKDTQLYGSVELRDESKTSEYGTFTPSEKERQSMVGMQQSGSKSLKLRLQDPLGKARGF